MQERAEIVFWLIGIAYICTAVISKLVYPQLGRIQPLPLVYALGFLLFIYLGRRTSSKIPPIVKVPLYTGGILTPLIQATPKLAPIYFVIWVAITGMTCFLYDAIIKNFEKLKSIGWKTTTSVAILLVLIGCLLGGIPLLNPSIRYSEYRTLYLAAGYLIALSIVLKPQLKILILGITVGVLSTFRTDVLAVILAYIFRVGVEEKPPTEKRLIIILILAGTISGFIARYWATLSSYPTWDLDFLETLLYRPGVTYTVYEKLFWMGFPFGNQSHKILFSSNPKLLVGNLFGRDVGYTYTMFGQPAYDFGVLGVLEGILMGMVLEDSSKFKTLNAMALTLLTLSIPIGIDAFFLPAILLPGLIASEVILCEQRT